MHERQIQNRHHIGRSRLARAIAPLYRWRPLRRLVFGAVLRLEGGNFYSLTARELIDRFHGVKVGEYSIHACMQPGRIPPLVAIGRYASIGKCTIHRRNHPVDFVSTHPFFCNSILGYVKSDHAPKRPLIIEHDAWIGDGAIITAGCSRIGIGAIVGAGAVVTKDVPDFAIVVGIPARVIRYRFDESHRQTILQSRWWECSIEELSPLLSLFMTPIQALSTKECAALCRKSRSSSAFRTSGANNSNPVMASNTIERRTT